MIEQAEAFIKHTKKKKLPCKIVMHDNDCKYSAPFLNVFENAKIKLHRTAIRSPNTVAFVERFVQTIKQECLDHFIVFGHKHMDVLCREFMDNYHFERPHQGLGNETIVGVHSMRAAWNLNLFEIWGGSVQIATLSCVGDASHG